tara:strand:+ start:170 stop:1390 length:1221 start_codon:yes stop_codon:yes gene_type:complete
MSTYADNRRKLIESRRRNRNKPTANTNENTTQTNTNNKPPGNNTGKKTANKSKRHLPHPTAMFYPVAKSQNERTGDSLLIKCFSYKPSKLGLKGDPTYVTARVGGFTNEGGRNIKEGAPLTDKNNNVFRVDKAGTTRLDNKGASEALEGENSHYYVELPIPQDINDSNTVTWGDDQMNIFQLAGISAANMMQETGVNFNAARDLVVNGLFGKDDQGGNSFGGIDQRTQNAIRSAISGKAINALGGQINTNSALGRAEGFILNSNLELLFDSVNLRTFPFSVNFSPRSPVESQMVKHIIRAFKSSMAAKKNSDAGEATGQGGVFLRAPDVFKLSYLHNGAPHPFLNKFKPCALTGMTVNYTNSGTYATYGDGVPISLKMNLIFKELNPIYHEDYEEFADGDNKGVGF